MRHRVNVRLVFVSMYVNRDIQTAVTAELMLESIVSVMRLCSRIVITAVSVEKFVV